MITRVDKLIEKLSEYDDDTQIRIFDLSNDSGESGVYKIKTVVEKEIQSNDGKKKTDAIMIVFEQYPKIK